MTSISHSALRAFHAVATEGSFTKAARTLNVTQPTLSGQVKGLEEQFGVRLFDRRKRKIELTDIGRNLLDITWRLFGLEAEAEQVLTAAKGLEAGASADRRGRPLSLHPFLAAFNRRYPNVRLSMSIGNSAGLKADLIDQRFDVVIAADIGGDLKLFCLPVPGRLPDRLSSTAPIPGRANARSAWKNWPATAWSCANLLPPHGAPSMPPSSRPASRPARCWRSAAAKRSARASPPGWASASSRGPNSATICA